MANRGGCIQPEIIPLEPDLDNTSEGNDTQNATHLQTGRFLLESAFFLGEGCPSPARCANKYTVERGVEWTI